MDVKGEVLLQLFNKSKLRNGTKTFLESNFSLFIVKFKKLGLIDPLRAVLKRRPQSGGKGFVQCGHFADKGNGVLQMRTFAHFGAKNFKFFEIYGVSARKRGRS